MKSLSIVLLLCLLLSGCGGDNSPVNEGKDKPIPPKKDK
jgi:PBP1b-binding outer membrane lipoprotein LpoB